MATRKTAAAGSTLKRKLNPMPVGIHAALQDRQVLGAYRARPVYQRNDYRGWIDRAERAETRDQRLQQRLGELGRGDACTNMTSRPRGAR